MKNCDNCGERIYHHGCVNCNEAGYIIDQYEDLEMEVPQSLIDADREYKESVK